MAIEDINGRVIKEGDYVKFSTYTPHEESSVERVVVKFGKLWAGCAPLDLLSASGASYRKIEIVESP